MGIMFLFTEFLKEKSSRKVKMLAGYLYIEACGAMIKIIAKQFTT